jgi:diguanylate cyclase (GGDEF)-like protein/PAS domain S-box-containing protein
MTGGSDADLRTENEDLRARLDEAEDTLRAIRSGEVDSLVVMGDGGEQVFSLKGADQSYRILIENMSEGALTMNTSGMIIYANRRFAEMLKSPLEKVISSQITTWVAPDSYQAFKQLLSNRGEKNNRKELDLVADDDTRVPVSLSSSFPLLKEIEDMTCLLATDLTEINAYKRNEQELRIAAIAFNSYAGIVVTDSNNMIVRVNDAYTKTTGYAFDEIKGTELELLSSARKDDDFYTCMLESINKNGSWEGEVWSKRKNGEAFLSLYTINTVKDKNGVILNYVGTINDITLSNATKEKIKNLAYYDQLTLLPNRRLLMDRLTLAKASSKRNNNEGAILFLDLDYFKKINDTLGHDMGDLLLQEVAKRLSTCVREDDTVARLGGDEFVVMLEGLGPQPVAAAAQAEVVARKIIVELGRPYQLDTHEYHITPSIGVTLFNQHPSGIARLLGEADIAMYQAKKEGRNTLRFFSQNMQDAINIRAALENDLRKALDEGQFQLYYQMQVDNQNHPSGVEALIRWIHPERGFLLPSQFIQLAEEVNLVETIGEWVLETACAQLKLWQDNALTRELVLSVNVSTKQFRNTNFTSQVKDIANRHAINPKRLMLEVTESVLLEDVDAAIDCITVLKEIGIQFALDDFGTGYSSLQYLNKLPLCQLKIDQSFVSNIKTGRNITIINTIIDMSKNLGISVIAEGVETNEQRQILQNSGCLHYQGYLFGNPIPVDQFEELLRLMAIKQSE